MADKSYLVKLRVAHPKAAALAASKGYGDAAKPEYVKRCPVILSQKELDDLKAVEPWAIIEPVREQIPEEDESLVESAKKSAKGKAAKAKPTKADAE